MDINYKKLAGAITLGMVSASAVKVFIGSATTYVGAAWAKRKRQKELEKELGEK